MVAKNNNQSQTSFAKHPKNKQDTRNKKTFSANNNHTPEVVGEFKGGIFLMPGEKKMKNSIEESRPRMNSENTLVIRDFKDGYFVERSRSSSTSPEIKRKVQTATDKKKIDTPGPVLLTPAHLRSQSLPQTFIPENKSSRKVQDFILSQNISIVPKINSNFDDLSYCSPPNSPEKWAGGAYTNSPPPKQLPCPQF